MNDSIDMAQAERDIRRNGWIGTVALVVAAAAGYWLIPQWLELPQALPERLAFALQWSLPVLACLLVAVMMVATGRRYSPRDVAGAAAGPPSERIALPVAFLQNTLEQAVLAVGLYLAWASLLTGRWLALIPVAAAFFVVGRILFYRHYLGGPTGRGLGMILTMLPTLVGYAAVAAVWVVSWF